MRNLILVALLCSACGDDDGPEADRLGVGAECTSNDDCLQEDAGIMQECLLNFAGGYCGIEGCTSDADCPEASACIAHTDGINYCFRVCVDKPECNANRSVDNEANCSSNVTFTDGDMGRKACVPPSGS